jgi:PAS domain
MGESCYRLISRTGSFIYLKTRGILEIDEMTREVRSFICINTLVSDEEGRRLVKEMKKKFSAIISEAELNAMENNVVMDVENPQLLERAILNLITNLNNQPEEEDDIDDDASSVISEAKSTKAPLAIIAPNTVSVKPTVSKAFDVITKVRGKKNVQVKDEPMSPDTSASSSSSSSIVAISERNAHSTQTVKVESLLSPTSSFSVSSQDSDVSSPFNGGNGYGNRSARSSEFYSNYENLPHHYDQPDMSSSSERYSANYNTTANNHHRSSVLKRTHSSVDNNNDDDYNEQLKRRMLSNDLSPVSQVLPQDLLANSAASQSGENKQLSLIYQ